MTNFLRAAMARADAEREARLAATPGHELPKFETPKAQEGPRVRRFRGSAQGDLGPKVRLLRANGMGWADIGRRLGISDSYACRLAKGAR